MFLSKWNLFRHIFPGVGYHLVISYLIHSGLFVFVFLIKCSFLLKINIIKTNKTVFSLSNRATSEAINKSQHLLHYNLRPAPAPASVRTLVFLTVF